VSRSYRKYDFATHLERLKYCRDAIGFTIVNGNTPVMKLGKTSYLFPTFCISKVFSRPATFYLVLINEAECPCLEPPVDVFSKRFKTPILVKSKVIHKWAATPVGDSAAANPLCYFADAPRTCLRSPPNVRVLL